MQKLLTQRKFLSHTENKTDQNKKDFMILFTASDRFMADFPSDQNKKDTWEAYSTLHDSFAEQLSYESSQRRNSDFWQLNYI